MKYFFLSFFFVAAIVISAAGYRGGKSERPPIEILPDMDHQPKIKFQTRSDFFADGLGARRPVANTVPMGFEVPAMPVAESATPPAYGFSNGKDYYHTGRFGDFYGDGLPSEIKVTADLIERGAERYAIHCTVCHGASGNGKGITSRYGILNAFNFHLPGSDDPSNLGSYRTDGAIFDVITHGKGLMGGYGANITVNDRWAIVAYIRTLQMAVREGQVAVQ